MKKRFMLTLVCLMAAISWVAAQNSPITGIVISAEDNEPIIGASVLVKGSTTGAVTDLDGKFTITDAPAGATTLQVSFVGMITQEVPITPGTIRVTLKNDAKLLDEVVVTALGIAKKEKSLTYSTQVVNGDELVRAKDPNMMNALAGKTAGVQINKSSSGLGGSSKVIIRGNRSVSGNNQPLYVIDGVPFGSSTNENTSTTIGGDNDSGNYDRGDGISNLNPDDIESMNILKGPAAAALYGSSAANGVVIINTKRGKEGRASISFNTNTTFDMAAYGIPEFQNHYTGQTTSWGGKINGSPDYTDDFFKTGVTTINSLSLSMGSKAMQTYFSYANTYGKGVVEGNRLVKHNFNFRETANFFNNKLTVDANVNAMYQKGNNRTTSGGYYMNPLVGLYHFPRGGVEGGKDFNYYKDNYQVLNTGRNIMDQNWYKTSGTDMEQNPYWLINKVPNEDTRYRTLINLSVKYQINDYFSIQARGSADYIVDKDNTRMYAGTSPILCGMNAAGTGTNGRYSYNEQSELSTYGDVLFTYQQQFENFSFNASVGGSINDYNGNGTGFDSYPGTLSIPNVFTMQNVTLNAGSLSDWKKHTQSQSVFFTGQIGLKDQLFLDVTARNDWTSTLPVIRRLHRRGTAVLRGPLLKLHPVAVFQGGSHCHRIAFLDPKAAARFAVDGHTAQTVVDGYLVQLVPLCFQRHSALRHFKGELLAGLPAALRRCGCFAGIRPLQEGVFLRAFGPDGDQLARLHDLFGCAGVAVLVHDGAAVHGEVVQGRKECPQLYIAFGHGEAETLLVLPVLIRFHEFFLAGKLPHIKLAVVVELAVRNFCDDPCARQRLVDFLLFCPFGKELSLSCGLIDQIRFSIFCAQAYVALRHLKARCCPAFCKRDHRRASYFRLCRQCRCAHAQHHAQRHEGRKQPLGQGRLLHTERISQ